LSAFPKLRHVTDESWLNAVAAARELKVPAGKVVVRKGDPCRDFMLIAEGSIRVYEHTESGREVTLFRTGPGQICILTLRSLIEGTAYNAEAVTEEATRLVAIPTPFFDEALSRSPEFREFIFANVGRVIGNVMQLVERVTFSTLETRLACALYERDGRSGGVSITHEQLAHELGTTREVVSRALKHMEQRGLIRLHRGTIEVVSPHALREFIRSARP
jgi:CRP/FNR family transcriptional regulator